MNTSQALEIILDLAMDKMMEEPDHKRSGQRNEAFGRMRNFHSELDFILPHIDHYIMFLRHVKNSPEFAGQDPE